MDTYFLEALLHTLIGALLSPGHQLSPLQLVLRHGWDLISAERTRKLLTATSMGQSGGVIRGSLCLPAVLQVTRKNWHEIKRVAD